MVGGAIFAVVTKDGAPLAFVIAGIVALLTSYSCLRLTRGHADVSLRRG